MVLYQPNDGRDQAIAAGLEPDRFTEQACDEVIFLAQSLNILPLMNWRTYRTSELAMHLVSAAKHAIDGGFDMKTARQMLALGERYGLYAESDKDRS